MVIARGKGLRRLFCIGLLMLAPLLAPAQELRAFLDRESIFESETVLLTIEAGGQVQGDSPEVGLLTEDFEILSSQSNTQIEIVNGKQSSLTSWLFELSPKRSGELILPAMTLGPQRRTQAIKLTVLPQPATQAQQLAEDIFIEVSAEPTDPYVQAQVRYSERLFLGVNLRDESLRRNQPLSGVILQPLGGFKEYVAQRNGRNYRVYERNFALFPEHSGTLTLPELTLHGRTVPSNRQSGQTLSRGRRIQINSKPLTLNVRPRPSRYSGQHWLASAALTLTEAWAESPPSFRVGEPTTRTLVIEAKGVDAGQLPTLELATLSGAKSYPDQPVTATRHDGTWLIGQREQRIAIVPTTAGELVLPALQLVWWDTEQDQERVAQIPAQTVQVLPAAATAVTAAPVAAAATAHAELDTTTPSSTTPSVSTTTAFWYWLNLALLSVWLLTLLGWWFDRRRRRAPQQALVEEPTTLRQAKQALQQACRDNNSQAAARALLAWAAVRWPQPTAATNLPALAARLSGDTAPILALDRTAYAADASRWDGTALWQAFSGWQEKSTTAIELHDGLPPLYPHHST